jgi:hypothetical protein
MDGYNDVNSGYRCWEATMVYVRLARAWTDGTGARHGAGELVDVPGAMVPQLENSGVIAPPGVEPKEGENRYLGLSWISSR